MQKLVYLIAPCPGTLTEAILNSYGESGWQFVSILPTEGQEAMSRMVFMRPAKGSDKDKDAKPKPHAA